MCIRDSGDDTFTQNFGQARKYGFIRGAYHYFIPKTDARKQADFFIRTVQLAKGDLPPVLDVETTGKPVSYTHLDVYKRQRLQFRPGNGDYGADCT